jgi:Kdo2-lipid IVA lauroyltransferase/acyltransferase
MILLFKLAAVLPLWLARRIGLALGWLVWVLSPRYRALTRSNWGYACRSGGLGEAIKMSPSRAAAMLRKSIGHAGLIAAELPAIWCDPNSAKRMRITGLEAVTAVLQRGRGVVILTPHLGAFELSPRAFAQHHPITVLYRPARQPAFRRLMERLRPMAGVSTAPATGAGVRQLLRALKNGEAIGMLPDQVPSQGEGEWADFFGRPAYTMTLPIRLAQSTGAAIVWALAIRTKNGWHLDFSVWDCGDDFAHRPIHVAVHEMNQALEAQIARAPDQYLWAYNRYKTPRGVAPPASMPGVGRSAATEDSL